MALCTGTTKNASEVGVVVALGEVPSPLYWREGYQVKSLPKSLTVITLCLEGFLCRCTAETVMWKR